MVLPFIVFAIAVVGTLGNGLHQSMVAVGILLSPLFFRVTRAVTLGLADAQYVEAAELMGASQWWVLRKHIWAQGAAHHRGHRRPRPSARPCC